MLLRVYCVDYIEEYFYDIDFDNEYEMDVYITTQLPP